MRDPRIRAVVFDVGLTLWFEARRPDPEHIYRLAASQLALLVADWRIPFGEPLENIQRLVWESALEAYAQADARGTFEEPRLPVLIQSALAARGVDITADQAEAWWRTMYVPVRDLGWQLYPDALDVLVALKSGGLKVGLCTTRPFTSDMFAGDLEEYGLAPYVDAVVCSGDVGFVKPHAAPFDLVLQQLDVRAEESVMVGDACGSDMRGGKAAGMHTVWKLNGRYDAPHCRSADFAIHDLNELLALPLIALWSDAAVTADSLTPHEDRNADRY